MTFVVEDGTGKINANAYIDDTWADTYFSERGIAAWTGIQSVKQQAIVRATDYIEQRFRGRFRGDREFPDTPQALSWPRTNALYGEGQTIIAVPVELQKACAEYSLRALSATLAPDPVVDATGRIVISQTSTVGPLTKSTTFAPTSVPLVFTPYPAADMLLRPLLRSSNALVRA
jgi:hypothetical protein